MTATFESGAYGPDRFDCFGLICYVSNEILGIPFPTQEEMLEKASREEMERLENVYAEREESNLDDDTEVMMDFANGFGYGPVDEPRIGDLVAFSRHFNGTFGHIGIIIEENRVMHMGRRGARVLRLNSPLLGSKILGFWRKIG